MGGVGGREFQEGGNHALWLIHVDIWQKPTQFCKPITLQLKNKFNFFFKKELLPGRSLALQWLGL